MNSLLLSENLLSLTLHADLLINTHYWHSPTFRHGSLLLRPHKATMAKRQFFKHQRVKNIKIPHIRIQSAFKYWTLFRYKINSRLSLYLKKRGCLQIHKSFPTYRVWSLPPKTTISNLSPRTPSPIRKWSLYLYSSQSGQLWPIEQN